MAYIGSSLEDSGNFEETLYAVDADAVDGSTSVYWKRHTDCNLRSDAVTIMSNSSGEYEMSQTFRYDDEITEVKSRIKTDHVETDGLVVNPLHLDLQPDKNSDNMAKCQSGKNNSGNWDRTDFPLYQLPTGNNGENVLIIDNVTNERQQKYTARYSDVAMRKESFVKCKFLAMYNPMALSIMLAETGLFFEGHEESATCFTCGVILDLSSLVKQLNLWNDHIQKSPSCPFIQKKKGAARDSVQNGEKQKCDNALISAVSALMATPAAEALICNGFHLWFIVNTIRVNYTMKGEFLDKSELIEKVLEWDDGSYSVSTDRDTIPDIIAKFQKQLDNMTTGSKKVVSEKNFKDNAHTKNTVDGSGIKDNVHTKNIVDGCDIDALSNTLSKLGLVSASDLSNQADEARSNENKEQNFNKADFPDVMCRSSVEETHADSQNGPSTVEQLELDNSVLRDQITCKICLTENVTVTFLPCGHLVCCGYCASAVNQCPLCRTDIEGRIRVYLTAHEETDLGADPVLMHIQGPLCSGDNYVPDPH